jgi:hypothetical protein
VAAAKRYPVEQVVAKLREAEKLQGQGMTIPQTCKRLWISEQTFYRRTPGCAPAAADKLHFDLHATLLVVFRVVLDVAPLVSRRVLLRYLTDRPGSRVDV